MADPTPAVLPADEPEAPAPRISGRVVANVLVVVVVIAGVVLVLVRGAADNSGGLTLDAGTAWFPSPSTGTMIQIEGATGTRTAQVPVTDPNAAFTVAQSGSSGIAVDTARSQVRRVDGATHEPTPASSLGNGADPSMLVRTGGGAVWAIDHQGTIVRRLDPKTLVPVAEQYDVAGPVTAAVASDDGTLWVTNAQGHVRSYRGGATSTDHATTALQAATIVLVADQPVVVDPGRAVVPIDPVSGAAQDGLCVNGTPEQNPAVSGAVDRPWLLTVAPRTGTLTVTRTSGEGAGTCATIAIGEAGHTYGPAVEHKGFVFVPDLTVGRAVVVEPDRDPGKQVRARLELGLTGQPDLGLLVHQNHVWFDDRGGDAAGVITDDLTVFRASKTAADPSGQQIDQPIAPDSATPATDNPNDPNRSTTTVTVAGPAGGLTTTTKAGGIGAPPPPGGGGGNVQVPNVVGMKVGQGNAALDGVGLAHTSAFVLANAAPGTIVAMNPPAGTAVNKGSTVTLSLSTGPNPVSVGSQHACAIRLSSGGVVCWGNNNNGELGNGTENDSNTPVVVSGFNNALAVAVGDNFTCAIKTDGSVWCWGLGDVGQTTSTQQKEHTPFPVQGIGGPAVAITAGPTWNCVLLANRTGRCWGSSQMLGDGTGNGSFTPVVVSGLNNAVAITAGFDHTCAALADSTIRCWGQNDLGQLDANTGGGIAAAPVQAQNHVAGRGIDADGQMTCALTGNGAVSCWGRFPGSGGDPLSTTATSDGALGGDRAVGVAMGAQHLCVVLQGGSIRCFVGDPTTRGTPQNGGAVTGITNGAAVAAASDQTCAALGDGSYRCWGRGVLGNGSTDSATPAVVNVGQ